MKKKILFVVNVDWFFTSHRLPLALEAINKGYEVHLACHFLSSSSTLRSYGIICHEIPFTRSNSNPLDAISLFKKIYLLFLKVKPSLVHLVTIKPILIGGMAARILKLPAAIFAISGLGYTFISEGFSANIRRRFIGLLYAAVFRHSNSCVIFQNTSDQCELSNLTGLDIKQSLIIPGSGVDIEVFSQNKLPSSPIIVMMASRLLRDKGVYEFISAAKKVKIRNQNIKFVLVGSPDLENPSSILPAEVNQWVTDGSIEYWGHQDDMPATISKATIVVLPSYREGLPKILIEAAACGRPVITTDVPGCRDAIIEKKTGLLVEKRNEKDLADKINYLISNIHMCTTMGAAGRSLVEEKFSEHLIAKQHMVLYKKLI